MPHTVNQGPHPNIMVMEYLGDLTQQDLMVDDELHLNEGHVVYILLDGSKMSGGLPEGFLEGVRESFFVHKNMGHLALYLESTLLRGVALMVAKLTRRQDKLTLHESRAMGIVHLEKLVKQAGL